MRTIAGFEALVRWEHPTRGLVLPSRLHSPTAEDTGLIIDIGQWVLQGSLPPDAGMEEREAWLTHQ